MINSEQARGFALMCYTSYRDTMERKITFNGKLHFNQTNLDCPDTGNMMNAYYVIKCSNDYFWI